MRMKNCEECERREFGPNLREKNKMESKKSYKNREKNDWKDLSLTQIINQSIGKDEIYVDFCGNFCLHNNRYRVTVGGNSTWQNSRFQ